MKLFKFGKLSKYHLYCLALPIFTFAKGISQQFAERKEREKFIFFNTVLTSFGILFGGSFDFFFKVKSCSKNNVRQKKKNIDRSFQNPTKTGNKIVSLPKEDTKEGKEKCYLIILCLFICILDICVSIGYFVISSKDEGDNFITEFIRIFQFVFILIITKFLYGLPIFSHRILGFGFIFIGLSLITLPVFILNKDEKSIIIIGAAMIGLDLIIAIEIVFSKWIMEKYSILPLQFMLMFGIFESIFSISLFFMPLCINKECDNSFCKILLNASPEKIFLSKIWGKERIYLKILHFIFILGYNLLYFNVIYFLTPNHINISDTISIFFFWIFSIFYDSEGKNKSIDFWIISQIIGNIFCLIGCSIYNELIILNFCGLNTYCRESITIRGTNEIEDIEEIGVNTNSPAESLVS